MTCTDLRSCARCSRSRIRLGRILDDARNLLRAAIQQNAEHPNRRAIGRQLRPRHISAVRIQVEVIPRRHVRIHVRDRNPMRGLHRVLRQRARGNARRRRSKERSNVCCDESGIASRKRQNKIQISLHGLLVHYRPSTGPAPFHPSSHEQPGAPSHRASPMVKEQARTAPFPQQSTSSRRSGGRPTVRREWRSIRAKSRPPSRSSTTKYRMSHCRKRQRARLSAVPQNHPTHPRPERLDSHHPRYPARRTPGARPSRPITALPICLHTRIELRLTQRNTDQSIAGEIGPVRRRRSNRPGNSQAKGPPPAFIFWKEAPKVSADGITISGKDTEGAHPETDHSDSRGVRHGHE